MRLASFLCGNALKLLEKQRDNEMRLAASLMATEGKLSTETDDKQRYDTLI